MFGRFCRRGCAAAAAAVPSIALCDESMKAPVRRETKLGSTWMAPRRVAINKYCEHRKTPRIYAVKRTHLANRSDLCEDPLLTVLLGKSPVALLGPPHKFVPSVILVSRSVLDDGDEIAGELARSRRRARVADILSAPWRTKSPLERERERGRETRRVPERRIACRGRRLVGAPCVALASPERVLRHGGARTL